MPDRRLTAAFAVAMLVGVAGLLIAAVASRESLAFTLGVTSSSGVAAVRPGHEACQGPITVPPDAGFERVGLRLGTYFKSGPAVEVLVRGTGDRRVLSRGRLAGGYPDIARAGQQFVTVSPAVAAGRRIDVCVANRGTRRVAIFGSGGAAARTSSASLDGRAIDGDLDLAFNLSQSRSVASSATIVASRASLFRPDWVGSWTYAVIALIVVVGVPVLIRGALVRATRT